MIPRTPSNKYRNDVLATAATANPSPGTKEAVLAARQKKLKDVEEAYLESLRKAREDYYVERQSAADKGGSEAGPDDAVAPAVAAAGVGSAPDSAGRPNLKVSRPGGKSASKPTGAVASHAREMLTRVPRPGTASVEGRLEAADFDREVDRLKGRIMEVEAVLRLPFETSKHVQEAQAALEASRQFYLDLGVVSDKLGVLKGQTFQELLGRGGGRRQGGQLGRERLTGLVKLEDALSTAEISKAISSAEAMCDLVRVKIEDDNDLGLANMVLEDCRTFFAEMSTCARSKHASPEEFFFVLRMD